MPTDSAPLPGDPTSVVIMELMPGFRLPAHHYAQLRRQAADHDRTVAAELRRAVRLYLTIPSQQP